jgi:7,8-dihydropterin-6-yl-methyl-4-(beta-D-ribofuranosyl)aminobenzene 5'-phosphate synthase
LVISHHHYDHGGGLGRFFVENDHATVYLRRSSDVGPVAEDAPGVLRPIGLDDALLQRYKDRVVMLKNTQEILPGLHVITDIPTIYPKPHGDQRLKIQVGGVLKPDPFNHELVTVIEEDNALVIMTGCAHNGVLNMIAATREALPNKPIKAVVGGFHLHHEDQQTVHAIGEALLSMEIPLVVTGHCTGDEATDELARVLGDKLIRLYTGLELIF